MLCLVNELFLCMSGRNCRQRGLQAGAGLGPGHPGLLPVAPQKAQPACRSRRRSVHWQDTVSAGTLRKERRRTLAALAAAMSVLFFVAVSMAQDSASRPATNPPGANSGDLVYQCPMDHDVRSNKPGFCPRCGMKLKAGIPEPQEFPVNLSVTPPVAQAGCQRSVAVFSARSG